MLRRSRPVSVKVLCLSMTPQGSGLGPALDRLGYKVYDLQSVFSKELGRKHPNQWAGILNKRDTVDIKMFEKHDAVVGIPVTSVYRQAIGSVPDYTKIILVEELDKEAWAESVRDHAEPLQRSLRDLSSKSSVAKTWTQLFDNAWPKHRDGHVGALEDFEEYVKKEVPPERLFVYNHGDGWEPLCHFLGIDEIPDEPFPSPDFGGDDYDSIRFRMERACRVTRIMSIVTNVMLVVLAAPILYAYFVDYQEDQEEAIIRAQQRRAVPSLEPTSLAGTKPDGSDALAASAERRKQLLDFDEPSKQRK